MAEMIGMTNPGGMGGCFLWLVHQLLKAEGFVGMDVEALLWWWSFGKSVGDISAEDEKVFSCGDGIKQSGAGLVDAVGVFFVEDFDVTRQ